MQERRIQERSVEDSIREEITVEIQHLHLAIAGKPQASEQEIDLLAVVERGTSNVSHGNRYHHQDLGQRALRAVGVDAQLDPLSYGGGRRAVVYRAVDVVGSNRQHEHLGFCAIECSAV